MIGYFGFWNYSKTGVYFIIDLYFSSIKKMHLKLKFIIIFHSQNIYKDTIGNAI